MKRLNQAVLQRLEDPAWMRAFAGWNVIFWIALVPVSAFFGWVESSAFISYLSLVALILSSLSWWQSGRVEVRQDRDADVQEVLDLLKKMISKDDEPGRRI